MRISKVMKLQEVNLNKLKTKLRPLAIKMGLESEMISCNSKTKVKRLLKLLK